MSRGSKWLTPFLIFGLSFAPCSLWSAPQPSSQSVVLSSSDYEKIVAEIQAAQAALDRSSTEIKRLSKDLTTRSILCGTLGVIATLELGYIIASKK